MNTLTALGVIDKHLKDTHREQMENADSIHIFNSTQSAMLSLHRVKSELLSSQATSGKVTR